MHLQEKVQRGPVYPSSSWCICFNILKTIACYPSVIREQVTSVNWMLRVAILLEHGLQRAKWKNILNYMYIKTSMQWLFFCLFVSLNDSEHWVFINPLKDLEAWGWECVILWCDMVWNIFGNLFENIEWMKKQIYDLERKARGLWNPLTLSGLGRSLGALLWGTHSLWSSNLVEMKLYFTSLYGEYLFFNPS